MQLGLETEKDIREYLRSSISLTKKMSIIRNLHQIEEKIKLKEQSRQKQFQQLPPDSNHFLRKRSSSQQKQKKSVRSLTRKDEPTQIVYEITRKEPQTPHNKSNPDNNKRTRIRVEQRPTKRIKIVTSSNQKAAKQNTDALVNKSLFKQFVGTMDAYDLFVKNQKNEQEKQVFGFMINTLPVMQISSPEQFEKYIAIISINLKIKKQPKKEILEEASEANESDDNTDESEKYTSHPFTLLAQKLIQTESIQFSDRMRLLESIDSSIKELISKKEGVQIVNAICEYYLNNEKSRFEILKNWTQIKDFVKKIDHFSKNLLTAINTFETTNRPESCLSIELALLVDDESLKEECLRNSIRFADVTVFNCIKENFIETPLFQSTIIPFSKEQFLEYSQEKVEPQTEGKQAQKETLIVQRKVGPLIFCVFYEKSLLDFLFEEFPKTNELIQSFFLKQWPKIFGQCIVDKGLLFKYFKGIIDILDKEVTQENETKETDQKAKIAEESVNPQV